MERMPVDGIASVRQYLADVTAWLNGKSWYPRARAAVDMVILALLSKAIVVGEAVCTLVDAGCPEEAFGLSRTSLDVFFTVRYITNQDCFERANKFSGFSMKRRAEWWRIINKHFSSLALHQPADFGEVLEKAKKFPNPHWWTGRGDHTSHIAMEEDMHEKDPTTGRPMRFECDYEVVYKWTSEYVHASIGSLNSHCVYPFEAFRIRARSACSTSVGEVALFNVAAQVQKTLVCVLRFFHADFPDALENSFKVLVEHLKEIQRRSSETDAP